MAITTPPVGTDPPALPDRDNPIGFPARADVFLAWLVSFYAYLVAALANVYGNAVAAFAAAEAAAASQDSAASSRVAAAGSAAAAAASAGGVAWVSGVTYAVGDRRWSLINQQLYRRITAGGGVIDPKLDAVNWARVWVEPEMVTAESLFFASLF